MSDSQDKANAHRALIIHRHLQRKFDLHREKLEAHKGKGAAFRAAVEELEKKLFG
jgi:hypothetical protein